MQDAHHIAVFVTALQLPDTVPLAQLAAPWEVAKRRVNALAAIVFLTQVLKPVTQLPTEHIVERLQRPVKTRGAARWLAWVEKEIVECLYEYQFYEACPAYTQLFLDTVRDAHGASSRPHAAQGGVWAMHRRLEVLRDLYKNVIVVPIPFELENENFYASSPSERETTLLRHEHVTYRHLTALDR